MVCCNYHGTVHVKHYGNEACAAIRKANMCYFLVFATCVVFLWKSAARNMNKADRIRSPILDLSDPDLSGATKFSM